MYRVRINMLHCCSYDHCWFCSGKLLKHEDEHETLPVVVKVSLRRKMQVPLGALSSLENTVSLSRSKTKL